MPWTAAIPVAASIVGGLIQGDSSSNAANNQADALRQAAANAQFRPIGVTTNFGGSYFNTDPNTGYLSSAGYNLNPQLQGLQNGLLGGASSYNYQPDVGFVNGIRENSLAGMRMAMQQAPNAFNAGNQLYARSQDLYPQANLAYGQGQNLFQQGNQVVGQGTALAGQAPTLFNRASELYNTGASYLGSAAQAEADYMNRTSAALAPKDEQTLAAIRNQIYQTGRSGLSTGGTEAGGLLASNPELAAYYNSLAQRNLDMATKAQAEGRTNVALGGTLYGQGAQLGTAGAGIAGTAANIAGTGANIQGIGGQLFNVGANQYQTAANLVGTGNQSLQTGGGLLETSSRLGTNAINQELGKYSIQNAALNTLGNYLGQANTIETMGQQGMNLGSALGAQQSTGGARAAPYYQSAASSQFASDAYNPLATAFTAAGSSPALNTWFNNIIGSNPVTNPGTFTGSNFQIPPR